MADPTVIGRASFVRGRVSGSGDLEIAGRVEGDVAVSGEVSIEASGLVAANVSARRIVVRGAGEMLDDRGVQLRVIYCGDGADNPTVPRTANLNTVRPLAHRTREQTGKIEGHRVQGWTATRSHSRRCASAIAASS